MELGLKFFALVALVECVKCVMNETGFGTEQSRVLSRKKRFLVFPDGSSFQLVFCVQTAALIPIGDIFLYGQTAAIAWNLPTDPMLFHMFKDQTRPAQRRGDQEHQKKIYYLDEQGKVIAKVPYKRAPIINPVFAKRSVDDKLTYREKLKLINIDRNKMHETQLKEDFLIKQHNMDKNSKEFHRNSRLSLFEKLETFFSALGQEGRQCVLRKLCKAGQKYTRQGTFLQEMFRVVFTLPKGSEDGEYDKAHAAAEDCQKLYPGCDDFSDPVELKNN